MYVCISLSLSIYIYIYIHILHIYIHIYQKSYKYIRIRTDALDVPAAISNITRRKTTTILTGWHYLSKATCLTRPHLFHVFSLCQGSP